MADVDATSTPGQSTEATTASPGGPDELVDLPKGEGLKLNEADSITRRSLTTVVLIAGTADSGKTTLLSSLYLLFHRGVFGGHLFAGCSTLMGFEKRVHYCRVASGLELPTTERSKFSELLHLRVRRKDLSQPSKDLLLCDFWGEDFREARDSVEGCKRLTVIRRADVFVLLVDGARLSKIDARQQAKSDPTALLRNILDCEMLTETARVDVMFTKWDVVISSPDKEEIERFAAHVEEDLRRQFAGRLEQLSFWRIAAHPRQSRMPLGYGLEKVFPIWASQPAGRARRRMRPSSVHPGACEYDRFLRRTGEISGQGEGATWAKQ